jgi:flagellar biosynthetic protein FlhB
MADDSTQEKTEDASERKLQRAKEKGQVPRSKEMGTASVLIAAAIGMYFFGSWLGHSVYSMTYEFLTLDPTQLMDPAQMLLAIPAAIEAVAMPLLMFIVFLFVCAFLGNILVGGLTLSAYSVQFRSDKLSPLRGMKRMFGLQALVELAKGIAKVLVVMTVVAFMLYYFLEEIVSISYDPLDTNIHHALEILSLMFILLCLSMLLIVSIDVPYQIWKHANEQKMTKQEVKDERKDTDGNPEVKSRIRKLQYEMAQRRMMEDVPKADAVIVNPEHYAVALKYDVSHAKSPFVVAKGIDDMAFKIREIAVQHSVPIIVSPRLARAIYYTTNINQEIPEPLFVAVAQVLAYIYQLAQYNSGQGKKPVALPKEFDLPDELELPDEVFET